ncbi:MAG: hypothetical protein ACTS5F_00590 [Candidatus Hodgkinia cicadicola]
MQIKLANIETSAVSTVSMLARSASKVPFIESASVLNNEISTRCVSIFTLTTSESISVASAAAASHRLTLLMLATSISNAKLVIVFARGFSERINTKLALSPNGLNKTIILTALRCERISHAGVKLLSSRSIGFQFCSKEMSCAVGLRQTCRALQHKADWRFEAHCVKFIKFALCNCTQKQINENRLLKFSLSTSAVRCLEVLLRLKALKPHLEARFAVWALRANGRSQRNLLPIEMSCAVRKQSTLMNAKWLNEKDENVNVRNLQQSEASFEF